MRRIKPILYSTLAILFSCMLSYEFTKRHFVSKANVVIQVERAAAIEDQIRLLLHGEKYHGTEAFSKLDCDFFLSNYGLIRSRKVEIEDPYFIYTDKGKDEALKAIERARRALEEYRDRHGPKDCEKAKLIM